jgi:hypothetical protein
MGAAKATTDSRLRLLQARGLIERGEAGWQATAV